MEEPKPYLSRLRWQRDLCLSPRYYRVKDLSIGTLAGYNPRVFLAGWDHRYRQAPAVLPVILRS